MAAFSRKSRLKLLATIFATEFAFGLPLLLAQNASANAASPEQAKKIYAVQCSLCHGAEAHGGEYGPALNGTNDLHGKSAAWLREVIKNGIPAGGMPAFNLPAGELAALASWIESMNIPATQSADARQPRGGRAIFLRCRELRQLSYGCGQRLCLRSGSVEHCQRNDSAGNPSVTTRSRRPRHSGL